jgi:hypothetical protein
MKDSSQDVESSIFRISIRGQIKVHAILNHITNSGSPSTSVPAFVVTIMYSKQAYKVKLQSFLGKQHACFLGRCTTDHSLHCMMAVPRISSSLPTGT